MASSSKVFKDWCAQQHLKSKFERAQKSWKLWDGAARISVPTDFKFERIAMAKLNLSNRIALPEIKLANRLCSSCHGVISLTGPSLHCSGAGGTDG